MVSLHWVVAGYQRQLAVLHWMSNVWLSRFFQLPTITGWPYHNGSKIHKWKHIFSHQSTCLSHVPWTNVDTFHEMANRGETWPAACLCRPIFELFHGKCRASLPWYGSWSVERPNASVTYKLSKALLTNSACTAEGFYLFFLIIDCSFISPTDWQINILLV